MNLLLAILLATSTAQAKTNLFTAIPEQIGDEDGPHAKATLSPPNTTKTPSTTKKHSALGSRSWSMVPQGQSIISVKDAVLELKGLKPGEIVDAVIPMSVIAFSEGKAPVVAELRREGHTYVLWGDAVLEKISKRITIEFTKIREKHSDLTYSFKASALDLDGTLGLEGELHTGEAKYFVAELLSAAAAGFADSSVRRGTNALGNSVEEHSLDTQSKKAFSAAMLKSAERFGEKARQAPEYSVLSGPTRLRILIGSAAVRGRETSL